MNTNTTQLITENPNETLDQQINETKRFILHIDFSLSFFSLLTILLAVLFVAVLADHWLFADGLSIPLRFGVLLVLLSIIAFYTYRRIVPLLLYPINPVYAANVLEESNPSLKNSIVNWILLRKERLEQGNRYNDKLSERIFDGVTKTAVSGIHRISSERAVDLRGLTRWGIALTLCFLFFVVYATFSPKSPFTSLTRIILPISNIERPQAVRFLNVEPGNTIALQGEKLTISAEVVGRSNEPVYLFFSTDDGQAVRQAIPMSLPEGKTRYEVPFPPGKQGFVGGVDYWIAQNDSRSRTFRIEVRPTASIEIVSLKYRFPPYTGLPDETIENSGDIRAVEGTEVKIGVRSTIPLQRINLVFDNDPARTVGMKLADNNPLEATATLTLKLDPQNTNPTTIRNFSFQATDLEGYESRRSGIFRLEVLPDQPPMVQWADTDTQLKDVAQLELPLNKVLELPIQAEDRDFGLRYLRFHVESGNKQIRPVELLDSPATGATEHKGTIQRKTIFSPITSRLAEGDSAEIWAEAIDTKFPDPNNATTRRITVRIIAPQKQEQPPKENEKDIDEKKEQQNKGQEQDKNNDNDNNDSQNDSKDPNKNNENDKAQNTEQMNEETGKETNDKNSEKTNEKRGEPNEQQRSDEPQNVRNAEEQNEGQSRESNSQDDSNESHRESSKTNDNRSGNNSDNNNNDKANNSETDSANDKDGNESSEQKHDNPSAKSEQRNHVPPKNINPETQDGDAMEEILKQMQKEGRFDDKKLDEQTGENANVDKQANNDQKNQKDDNQNRQEKNVSSPEQSNSDSTDSGRTESDRTNSKPETQNRNEQNSERQGTEQQRESGLGQQQKDSQPNDNNQTNAKNNEQTNNNNDKGHGNDQKQSSAQQDHSNETENNGERQDKSVSESSKQQGDDQNSGHPTQEVPADSADKTSRQRDDSLDPNSRERSDQGGDSKNPQKTDTDVNASNQSASGGDEGSGQKTGHQEQKPNQQTQSTQSAEQGQSVDAHDNSNGNGIEQQNGSSGERKTKDKSATGQPNESNSGESGNSDSRDVDANNSDLNNSQGSPNQSELPQSENSASGKSSQNQSSQNQSGQNQSNPSSLDSVLNASPTGGQGSSALNVETPTEDPNLEYTKKVTNLVLEYLEDQLKAKPNQELLDNLGWTEQELRDFYRKWQQMSEQSKRPEPKTPNDENQWKEAFKSLGLRPAQDRQQLRKSRTGVQDESKATESQRFAPPSAIKERFKRYTEGIGK